MTSQSGHLTAAELDALKTQKHALEYLIDHPPASWRRMTREARGRLVVHLWSRIRQGQTVRVAAWRGMPASLELRWRYGLTPSGAMAVLRKHKAPKEGRGYEPLSGPLRRAIHDDRLLMMTRREAARLRQKQTGCTPAAAERWARRHIRTVERTAVAADVATLGGQARTIARLAAAFPAKVVMPK